MSDEQAKPHWKRGFWNLFVVQFQGAFSDNLFKALVIFIVTDRFPEATRNLYIAGFLAVFSLPFLLFSMAGGYLADRYPKPWIVVGTKGFEIVVMAAGIYSLFTLNTAALAGVLFLMGVQSAFFGPSKYGLLPEILPVSRLSWGNGILGLGTFSAIISGTIVAGLLRESVGNEGSWTIGLILVDLALVGYLFSRMIPPLPPAQAEKKFRLNFMVELRDNLRLVCEDRILKLALVGSVYFWFIGALLGEPVILVYGKDLLDLSDQAIGIWKGFLCVGIALGCGLAGFLSGRKIEYGLVPVGAFGMAAAAGVLFFPNLEYLTVGITLWVLGIFGGLYDVPITTILQHRPDPRVKGSVMATNGWLTSAGVFAASGVFWFLKSLLGLSAPQIFLAGAVVTLGVGVFAVTVVGKALPEFLARMARFDFKGKEEK